jgi:hypothetical protein
MRHAFLHARCGTGEHPGKGGYRTLRLQVQFLFLEMRWHHANPL